MCAETLLRRYDRALGNLLVVGTGNVPDRWFQAVERTYERVLRERTVILSLVDRQKPIQKPAPTRVTLTEADPSPDAYLGLASVMAQETGRYDGVEAIARDARYTPDNAPFVVAWAGGGDLSYLRNQARALSKGSAQ